VCTVSRPPLCVKPCPSVCLSVCPMPVPLTECSNTPLRRRPTLVGCVAQWVERRTWQTNFLCPTLGLQLDRWPLMWVNHPLLASLLGRLSLSSFRGR